MRGSRVLVAMALSFLAAQSVSASTTEWKYYLTIQRIQASSDGNFILYFPTGTWNACQEGGTVFRVIVNQGGQNAEGVKANLAVAMTAFAMNKSVTIAFDSDSCAVATVLVNR